MRTEEDPCNENVCIIAVFVNNIPESQQIELLLTSPSGNVDGEQDRPSDAAADQAGCGSDLEISKEQKAIERLVVEDEAIWDLGECSEPVEQALGQSGRTFPAEEVSQSRTLFFKHMKSDVLWTEASQEGTGLVIPLELASQEKEQGYKDDGD